MTATAATLHSQGIPAMNASGLEVQATYWIDAKGRQVPEHLIKPIDRARNQLVEELTIDALRLNALIADFKRRVFNDIDAFVELSNEQYGVQLGGRKGNITLYTYDGQYKIQVAIADRLHFDERLQAAKQLIDECIIDWSKDSRDEIRVLVQSAFQTDKQGKINTGRVLGLRQLDIADARWQRAMQAISDSLQVVDSKTYVRFYQRIPGAEEYRPIPLDIAALAVFAPREPEV